MMRKIFSRKFIPVLLSFGAGVILTFSFFYQNERRGAKNVLDFTLKDELIEKVEETLKLYSDEGWENTRRKLEEVRWSCKRGGCDPEVFFNDFIDRLASTLSNDQEFTYAGLTLGIVYSGNWRLADLDGDQENEIVVLQRDTFNPDYTDLKIIDFQETRRVTNYRLPFGYFSSPNSTVGLDPLEILDLTGDAVPEILTFLSSSKGGARLYVFQYKLNQLELTFKKGDLFYPEFTFSDIDNDGILEIIARGYKGNTKEKVEETINL